MRDPVWAYLETLPGKAAARFEWDAALSGWDRYPLFRDHFLQLTPCSAEALACPTDCGLGCPRRVVAHAADDVRAVCGEKRADPVRLDPLQVLVYRLNPSAVNAAVARALGIDPREAKLAGAAHTWRVGDFVTPAGRVFPVVLSLQNTRAGLDEAARSLCLTLEGPFVLAAPTRRPFGPVAEDLLARRRGLFIALDEELTLQDGPRFEARRGAAAVFSPLAAGGPAPGGPVFFQTPPRTPWERVEIRFHDGHVVSVRAGDRTGRFNYTQMGMASRQNGEPTLQWDLLRRFAENRGEIGWHSSAAAPRIKKQKGLLSKHLQAFFRLEGEPIPWDKADQVYRCRFRVLSEDD